MNKVLFKQIYFVHGIISLIVTGALMIAAPQQAFVYLAGVLFITFQFVMLVWIWKRVFEKKPVALTGLLVITKYAVLGIFVYLVARQGGAEIYSLIAGVTTLPASFLVLALKIQVTSKKMEN